VRLNEFRGEVIGRVCGDGEWGYLRSSVWSESDIIVRVNYCTVFFNNTTMVRIIFSTEVILNIEKATNVAVKSFEILASKCYNALQFFRQSAALAVAIGFSEAQAR
jgi:hypothetical protein